MHSLLKVKFSFLTLWEETLHGQNYINLPLLCSVTNSWLVLLLTASGCSFWTKFYHNMSGINWTGNIQYRRNKVYHIWGNLICHTFTTELIPSQLLLKSLKFSHLTHLIEIFYFQFYRINCIVTISVIRSKILG
jgi:hypothetical protein